MKKKQKKWLLRKVSGSRSKHTNKPDYAESRYIKNVNNEDLPLRQSIRKGSSILDTTLVNRWLYSKVGEDFDIVYSQFLSRIQPKYKDQYRDCIFWYVTQTHELTFEEEGIIIKPWSKKFYIDPKTNILGKHSDRKLKAARYIFLSGKFCILRYIRNSKLWYHTSEKPHFELIIKDEKKKLNQSHTPLIDNVIEKIRLIIEKVNQEITGLAMKSNNTEIILSRKKLLSIHFNFDSGLDKFYLLFEVEKDQKEWKVNYIDNEIVKIVRIKNRS